MRRVLSAWSFLLAIGLTGCLQFDEQEIHVEFAPGRDALDLQLVYRGVYDDGGRTGEQLDALLAGERWFAFGANFPLLFKLDDPRELEDSEVLALLAEHVQYERGEFFRDPGGRVCAWQHLRLARCREFFPRCNALLHDALKSARSRQHLAATLAITDPANHVLWAEVVAARTFPFVELRQGALVFRLPTTRAGHAQFVTHLLREAAGAAVKGAARPAARTEAPADSRPEPAAPAPLEVAIGLFAGCELSFVRTGDVTEIVLGNPERRDHTVHVPASGGYRDNLGELLASRKVKVRDDVTESTLAAAFAKFRAR